MTFEKHCEESLRLFGSRYEQVHLWLDELAGCPGIGMRHRKYRHHLEVIKKARELFGEQAALAARQHIISDLRMEGWQEGRDPFPQNEAHYVMLGLF